MLAPDTILQNRYRIIRQLGQGGMGTVYEAKALRLNTTVALKETHFTDERLRKQFEREAQLLASLRHPALPRVIDHFDEGEGLYLVMDFIEGRDLWEMLQNRGGPFPADDVIRWADQLLDALTYLHTQLPPIIHRDIKPQNLKLTNQGQIILLDFGLAKGFAGQISRVTMSGSIFGYTPNYAPLEQIQGTGTVPSSDLYGLAATLYHLMTGVVPPDALTRASAKVDDRPDPLKPADEVNPRVSQKVAEVLQKAMAQSPGNRFTSAGEMRAALREAKEAEDKLVSVSEAKTVLIETPDSAPVQEERREEQSLPPTSYGVVPTEMSQRAPDYSNERRTEALPTFAAPPPPTQFATPSALYSPVAKSKSWLWAILIAAGVIGIGALVLIYLRRAQEPSPENSAYFGVIAPPQGQTLRYITGGEPETIDPQVMTGPSESRIAGALFDGLVEYNEQTNTQRFSLAESWDVNADSTVWTFYLRKNAKWSDGKPITAQDFVYSWRRALSPELASRAAYFLYLIKNAQPYNEGRVNKDDVGVRALDDYTLEVKLERPAPYFIIAVLAPAFRPVPQQAIEKWGDKLWTRPGNIVTSGAFKLTEWTPNKRIVVERNPQYWDNENTKLDQIIFPVPSSPAAALEMYKAGEVDAMASGLIPFEVRGQLKGKKDYTSAPFLSTTYLSINTTFPPLNDVRVRRALSMAINRQEIANQASDRIPFTGFVPPLAGYQGATGTDYQPDEARRLLAEAGYPGGRGFPEIEILSNPAGQNRQIIEAVQAMLQRELGIKTKLVEQDFRVFLQNRARLNYKGLARNGWIGDFPDPSNYLDLFSTPSDDNTTGWFDPKYAAMLNQANTISPVKRATMLREAEAYLLEQQPVIPLFVGMSSFMRKPYVKNLEPNILDQHDWRGVSIDHAPIKE